MIGLRDYATLWADFTERRAALVGELEEVDGFLTHLAPLARRAGVDVTGALAAQVTATTGAANPAMLASPAEEQAAVLNREEEEEEDEDEVPAPGGSGIYARLPSTEAALHVMWSRASAEWPTPQIADAIAKGGFPSTSNNFRVNVYTTMKRLRKRGLVERVGEGLWVLTEEGCAAALEVAEKLEKNESTADVGASAADSEDALMLDRGNPSLGV